MYRNHATFLAIRNFNGLQEDVRAEPQSRIGLGALGIPIGLSIHMYPVK